MTGKRQGDNLYKYQHIIIIHCASNICLIFMCVYIILYEGGDRYAGTVRYAFSEVGHRRRSRKEVLKQRTGAYRRTGVPPPRHKTPL